MAAWEFQKLQNIAARNGWHQFISMQNYYNLLAREEEREMVPYCRDAGIGLIPWSPLARGVLSRPHHSNVSSNVPDRSIRQSTDQVTNVLVNDRQTEADHKILDRVEEIAKRKGINMAQTATAWVLSHPGTNPIMGLNSKKRIDEAVASIQVKLSEEEVAYLAEPYLPKGVTEIER
jgi:versiconal hemiacetal acetate reductase